MTFDQNNKFLYDFNMTFYQNKEFFDKENNLEIKELSKSQKKGACGSVLKDAKLKGSKKYELLYDFRMFFDQHNEFLYDLYMMFDQSNDLFDKENNLEIKVLQ